MPRTTTTILATALIIAVGAPAQAGPFTLPKSTNAKRQLKIGNKLVQVRSFELAIRAYKRGYLIEPKPIFLHNLGLAHRLKGDYKTAISYYRNFLRAASPHPKIRSAIQKLIKQMEDELAQAARSKPPTEPEPRKPEARKKTKKRAPVKKPRDRIAYAAPWYSDGIGWSVSAAGLVLTGLSAGLLVSASSLRGDAKRELSAATRDELNSRADTRQTWGGALGVIGVAALSVGIVKLILHDKTPSPRSDRAISVLVLANSIQLRGRF